MNYPHGLMSDGQAWLHWVFPFDDVYIRTANGGEPNLNDGLSIAGVRNRFFLEAKLAGTSKNIRFHHASRRLSDFALFE
jgi:hypothetical protein